MLSNKNLAFSLKNSVAETTAYFAVTGREEGTITSL